MAFSVELWQTELWQTLRWKGGGGGQGIAWVKPVASSKVKLKNLNTNQELELALKGLLQQISHSPPPVSAVTAD